MYRREFIKSVVLGLFYCSSVDVSAEKKQKRKTKVSLVRTRDRKFGVRKSVDLLGLNPLKNREVLIKPNFNSADPCPGSTHNDTLEEVIVLCKDYGAKRITIGERSGFAGMIRTDSVLKKKGIYEMVDKHSIGLINFDELEEKDWVKFSPKGNHWFNGFKVARPLVEAESVISTCCLKTHRFGGVFTMSLKLSVGAVKKTYMPELHASFLNMRKMIAEINVAYTPSLIILDGVDAFVDGGPDKGKLKEGNVFLAGTDRIAIDAVGVAILKELGSNRDIMERKIFEQDQIKRAVELGLGISSHDEIELITDDEESRKYAEKIKSILAEG